MKQEKMKKAYSKVEIANVGMCQGQISQTATATEAAEEAHVQGAVVKLQRHQFVEQSPCPRDCCSDPPRRAPVGQPVYYQEKINEKKKEYAKISRIDC